MNKNNLGVNESVRALFALCSDVSRLTVRGNGFFYLKPKHNQNLKVMKYILNENGVKCGKHRSHYYTLCGSRDLILRVPVYEIAYCANPDFRNEFELMYQDRHNTLDNCFVDKNSVRFFKLMSKSRKATLVKELILRTK